MSTARTHGGARPGAGRKRQPASQQSVVIRVPVPTEAAGQAVQALSPAERARRLLAVPVLQATGPHGAWVEGEPQDATPAAAERTKPLPNATPSTPS